MKLTILSIAVVAVTTVTLAASFLLGGQEAFGQYDDQYASATVPAIVCAPWSKEWGLSDGQWYFDWYRWCVDTSLWDPAYEGSWEIEWGAREWKGQANLCPEKGTCTISPGGGMKMSTNVP